ncbi:helicase C-terminal domain-containing protein [Streptomyces sp. AV19]|uniref:helicase C-terminal domain-containing protein n=1 Tax=Streptomyces sp. AV19 TaxID=2793068 RepID=UPI0018FE85C9|nr:helicase C-terminal domain-containing protein [Streptomyces sp. AV19]MBH1938446.1 helicase C-terminal domain-containing protein [Streptomyces sp. AV19]MDG4535094.1 helicase C-terminal domain-containing protein [Streptomyces sp. AV19]
MGGSPLMAWLRSLGAERLSAILAARPDSARAPEPRTIGELADRLQRTSSAVHALYRLPLPALQAAQALVTLPRPAPRKALEELLGAERPDDLAPALDALAEQALAWPDADGALHTAAALRGMWEAPLGLGPEVRQLLTSMSSEELRKIAHALGLKPGARKQERLDAVVEHHSDPDRILALIDSAPPRVRALLEEEPEDVVDASDWALTERWLTERALLVRSYGSVCVPAEATRALRGPGWHAPFDPEPPLPALLALTAAEVEREAAAAATAFAGRAATVLAECAERPPAALKSGGIGARELARIGKAAGCEATVVRLVLECSYATGLLAYEGSSLLITEDYDEWAAAEPSHRFTVLLRTWWRLGHTPSGSRDAEGKALPAVTRTPPRPGCLAARQALLSAAASLPTGHGAGDPAELGPLVPWFRPFAGELPEDSTPFATLIREAGTLGVLARGALTPLGAALLSEDPAALRAHAGRLLPEAVGTARFGADLTAVVTGTPTARLAALLDRVADREAHSAASVWRFGPASLRRALDHGDTAERIEAGLREVADGPLPQPLSYLIKDTARGHGRVRLAPAACVIHGEDTALLAEIAVHRKLSGLGLRRLAPTVLLCRTALPAALAALRAEGYAPVAETDDGAIGVERAEPPRAAAGHLPRPRRAPDPATFPGLAARLLAAPDRGPVPDPENGVPFDSDTEEILAGYTTALTLTDIRQLAHAIHEDEPLTIEYVAASGERTVRTISGLGLGFDVGFDPPYLTAYCHLREDDRVFALSRIQAVQPA